MERSQRNTIKGENFRQNIFEDGLTEFARLGNNAINGGRTTSEFVIVCIEVDDKDWRWLVDIIMPDHDWQQYRDKGQIPLARGTIEIEGFRDYMRNIVPAIGNCLEQQSPPAHVAHVCVMAGGGASLFYIDYKKVLMDIN